MINLTREEAQQVLDALEAEHSAIYGTDKTVKAIETLRARLAQKKLPYWEPCNPGCDPEFNGQRTAYCAQICHNAREALVAQPESKDDGDCQACEGNHCTAKTGCVALSNPPQNKWEPKIERKYSPDGVLLSEKIKYTPNGEWQNLKQHPVAWWYDMGDVIDLNVSGHGIPLYFVPPQREWHGLTDEEIRERWFSAEPTPDGRSMSYNYARAIEAKLKEKNT